MDRSTLLNVPVTDAARAAFAASGLHIVRGAIPCEAAAGMLDALEPLFRDGMRKDFLMPQSGWTPRKMNVVGGCVMNQQSDFMALYQSQALRESLSEIVGERIDDCPDPVENLIATRLESAGDTHGWHTDDYPIAFILCLEAPGEGQGGAVELKRGTGVECFHLSAGDAYILRSDKIVHRVEPVTKGARRTILNFTYSLEGLCVVPNGSAELLCA
jgi:hypothetical protein